MKTTTKKLPSTICRLPVKWHSGRAFAVSIGNRQSAIGNRRAFTLIELLVVISIIAIIAGFTLMVVGSVHRTASIGTATAELKEIEGALENYKAKYGSYPPSNPTITPLVNTLYYELSGVYLTNASTAKAAFVTLDGACQIPQTSYQLAFAGVSSGIGGVINCTKGTGEEGSVAQDFLPSLHANRLGTYTNGSGVQLSNLVTSVRGPDTTYMPLGVQDVNPFRYAYPGTNNPSSYDLWVQLVIRGKTNLICNWSTAPIINSPLP